MQASCKVRKYIGIKNQNRLIFVGGFFRMNEFEDLLNSVSDVNPGDVVTAEVLTVDIQLIFVFGF